MDQAEDVIVINCLWCSEPGFSDKHIQEFLTRDCDDKDNPTWFFEAFADLFSCYDCVEEFHQSLNSLLSSAGNTLHLQETAYRSNVTRLSSRLREIFHGVPEVDPIEKDEYSHSRTYQLLKSHLEVPLLELLSYPRLLLNGSLCNLFVCSLKHLLRANQQIEVTKKLPGVYLLLVHPDESVRRWSLSVVRGMGLVDWDDYDQLEEVVHWLFNVVLYDMFSDPLTDIGKAAWDKSRVVLLPSHLYNHQSTKDFWVGLCMLVTTLDATCIRSKLMSSSSGHPEIAENILETLNGDPNVFFPVTKCLSILLGRMGSRFWQFFKGPPKSMCKAIFSHSVFHESVEQMAHRESPENVEDSYSQLVYNRFSRSRSRENEDYADSVVFCWILPFVQSLLDFGPHMESDVCDVFRNVSELLKKEKFSMDSVLYQEVLIVLLKMSSLLYSKESYEILFQCQQFWLATLVESVEKSVMPNFSVVSNVIDFLKKLLSSKTALSLPNTSTLLAHLQTRDSTSNIPKKTVSSKSLSDHICLVLRSLCFGKTELSSIVKHEPVNLLPSYSGSKDGTSDNKRRKRGTLDFGLKDCSVVVTKKKVSPPTKSHSFVSSAKFEATCKIESYFELKRSKPEMKLEHIITKKRAKLSSASGASTDEMEEWECGPQSLRKVSLTKSESASNKKRLSLKTQPRRILYEQDASKSPLWSQPVPRYLHETSSKLSKPKEEPNLSEDKGTPPLSPSFISVSFPSVSRTGASSCEVKTECEPNTDSKITTRPTDLSIICEPKPLGGVQTPPLSSSSSDSELPSLHTLMTSPTKKRGRSPIRSRAAKISGFKEIINTISAGPARNSNLGSSKKKKDMPSFLSKSTAKKDDEWDMKKCEHSADGKSSSTNDIFMHGLSQREMKEFEKFSEDEEAHTCSHFSMDLSHDDVEKLYDFSDNECQALEASTPGDDNFSRDVDMQCEEKTVSVTEVKDMFDVSSIRKELLEDIKHCSSEESNISPPDSQSESTFVYRDFRDTNESSVTKDKKDVCESVFQAFEAEAKAIHLSVQTEEKALSKTSSDLQTPRIHPQDNGDTMARIERLSGFNNDFSEDEDIQKMYREKQRKKSPLLRLPAQHKAHVQPEDLISCAQQTTKQSPEIATASSSPATNRVKISCLSVDIVRLDIESVRNAREVTVSEEQVAKGSTSDKQLVRKTDYKHVRERALTTFAGDTVVSKEKSIRMSTLSLPAERKFAGDTVVSKEKSIRMSTLSLPAERKIASVIRKRKRVSPDSGNTTPLSPPSSDHQSKKLKLYSSTAKRKDSCKSQSSVEFLSARTKTSHAIPAVVEPPGMVYSKKKALLQKQYGDSCANSKTLSSKEINVKFNRERSTNSLSKQHSEQSHSHLVVRAIPHEPESRPKKSQFKQPSPPTCNKPFMRSKDISPCTDNAMEHSIVNVHVSSTSKPPISFASFPVQHISKHQQQPSLLSPKLPVPVIFGNALSTSTLNLMSSASTSVTTPNQAANRPALPNSRQHGSLPQMHVTARPPTINTKPKRLKTMDDLHTRVLCWDPSAFQYPEQDERGKRICPPCTDDLVRGDYTVPLTFLSYDDYFGVFAPLFFIELWETVFKEIDDTKFKPPPCSYIIDSCIPSGSYQLQLIHVKTIMPSYKAREYAHPNERDLVVVETKHSSEKCFAIVDGHKHNFIQGDKCEVFITVKVCRQPGFCQVGVNIDLKVVMSLTNEIRQWMGLVNFHASALARDILNPRGREYFCHPSHSQRSLRIAGSYNTSQGESIATAARAMCDQYALPRILLLQGPPGTGKTHTISGLIQEGFIELNRLCKSSRQSSLPGALRVAERKKPHLLVCAPSNAAVDEVIRKMIKDGVISGSTPTQGCRAPLRLNVVRIGNKDKIHPQIIPYSLDQIANKKIKSSSIGTAATKKKLDEVRQQISVVEKNIEAAEKEKYILSLSPLYPDKKTGLQSLEDNIQHLSMEKSKLMTQHKNLKVQCGSMQRDLSKVRKRILMDADVVCATLCGSGSYNLWECVRNSPQHFDCVIVDEASQCTELDILVPLRYRASKLVLVGDPLQLPATVRSMQAEKRGYGQSLFERLYKYFANRQENPVKMLRVQYRMLPEICCFPSKHFYSNRLQTDSTLDSSTVPFQFNPFVMFDVENGKEDIIEGSIRNTAESHYLIDLLKMLREKKVNPGSIGVITPYRAQEKHIKRLIKKELSDMSAVDVGTVDGFQGREKDIILLSCVRANSNSHCGSVGFLCNRKRLNVAITRSMRALYILGQFKTLQVNKDWSALIEHARQCNAINVVRNPKNSVKYILKITFPLKYIKSTIFSQYSTPPTLTDQPESSKSAAATQPSSNVKESLKKPKDPYLKRSSASILKKELSSAEVSKEAVKPISSPEDKYQLLSSSNNEHRTISLESKTVKKLACKKIVSPIDYRVSSTQINVKKDSTDVLEPIIRDTTIRSSSSSSDSTEERSNYTHTDFRIGEASNRRNSEFKIDAPKDPRLQRHSVDDCTRSGLVHQIQSPSDPRVKFLDCTTIQQHEPLSHNPNDETIRTGLSHQSTRIARTQAIGHRDRSTHNKLGRLMAQDNLSKAKPRKNSVSKGGNIRERLAKSTKYT